MQCDQVRELMGAYVYGDLSPDEVNEIKQHTHDCSECRQDLETRRHVVAAMEVKAPELTDADRQRVAWAVRGAVSNAPILEPRRMRWLPAFGLGLALLAGIALGMLANTIVSSQQEKQIEARQNIKPPIKVEVKEVPLKPAAKVNAETASEKTNSEVKHRRPDDVVRMTEAVATAVSSAIREGTAIAVSRKGHEPNRAQTTHSEEPVAVQPEKEHSPATPTKLPDPSSQNDARTTTEKN